VMMVAEKAADMILGNRPLDPATVEFYRHAAAKPRRRSTPRVERPQSTAAG
jgi:choline dehydrogenase